MSRRRRAEKRTTDPDPLYKSVLVAKFINRVMIDGKKALARNTVYKAMERFAKKVNQENVLTAFEQAVENAKPTLETKSRRVGGATYQVPVEVSADRRTSLAMKWIIGFSREKVGRPMVDSLSNELADCFLNQGTTIKKKDDVHRMAESNRAFAHYKW